MVTSTRLCDETYSETLTPAERVVLIAVAENQTAAQIAARLGNSIFTIRAHIRSSISKLGVSGRFAAVHRARQLGFIP